MKENKPPSEKYVCTSCGFIYDPDAHPPAPGVETGMRFEDLPENWKCPLCYVGKDAFDPL